MSRPTEASSSADFGILVAGGIDHPAFLCSTLVRPRTLSCVGSARDWPQLREVCATRSVNEGRSGLTRTDREIDTRPHWLQITLPQHPGRAAGTCRLPPTTGSAPGRALALQTRSPKTICHAATRGDAQAQSPPPVLANCMVAAYLAYGGFCVTRVEEDEQLLGPVELRSHRLPRYPIERPTRKMCCTSTLLHLVRDIAKA